MSLRKVATSTACDLDDWSVAGIALAPPSGAGNQHHTELCSDGVGLRKNLHHLLRGCIGCDVIVFRFRARVEDRARIRPPDRPESRAGGGSGRSRWQNLFQHARSKFIVASNRCPRLPDTTAPADSTRSLIDQLSPTKAKPFFAASSHGRKRAFLCHREHCLSIEYLPVRTRIRKSRSGRGRVITPSDTSSLHSYSKRRVCMAAFTS